MPGECECDTGLVVGGDDVVAFGLAIEHTLGDQLLWRGERGSVYFFQSELPYDVDQSYADAGHLGYRVAPDVGTHLAVGAGIYSFFRDHPCLVPAAISAPRSATFHRPFTKLLNGNPGILATARYEPQAPPRLTPARPS